MDTHFYLHFYDQNILCFISMTSVQCYSSTFLAPSVLRKNLKIHIFFQQKASIANNSRVIIDFMQKVIFLPSK